LAHTGRPEAAPRWSGFVLIQHPSWNETKGHARAVREAVLPMLDTMTIEAAERWAEKATLEMVEGEVSSLVL